MPDRSLKIRSSTETLHSLEPGEREYVLGSEPYLGVLLVEAEGVAPRHTKVWFLKEGMDLEDLGSATGTALNGSMIQGRVSARYPASVQIGEAELHVECAGEKVLSISTRTLRLVHAKPEGGLFSPKPEAVNATGRIFHPLVPPSGSGGSQGSGGTDCSDYGGSERGSDSILGGVDGATICVEMPPEDVGMDAEVAVRMAYTLKEVIGRGGMGRIYAAADQKLKREVALKVSRLSGADEHSAFLREAETLARLAHPNIVPIHNLGTDSHPPIGSLEIWKTGNAATPPGGIRQHRAPVKGNQARGKGASSQCFSRSHRAPIQMSRNYCGIYRPRFTAIIPARDRPGNCSLGGGCCRVDCRQVLRASLGAWRGRRMVCPHRP